MGTRSNRVSWHRQLRGLVLLLVTIAPLLAAAILGVLGRPIRHWLAEELGQRHILQGWWTIFFPAMAIVLAMLALTVIYRVARPGRGTNAERSARRDGGDFIVVAGERAIWVLCAPGAVQRCVRRACGGDRIDGVDATLRGDHISGCGVECRTGGGQARNADLAEQDG